MQSRRKIGKGRADGLADAHSFCEEIRSGSHAVGRADFEDGPADKQIWDIGQKKLADFICFHAPPPFVGTNFALLLRAFYARNPPAPLRLVSPQSQPTLRGPHVPACGPYPWQAGLQIV